ncbi:hypothetical protein [Paenibacillus sp. CF384]|uniref:hypothetical protein n=1 Tax=Paenibacillus sp. CF384 TaxID=1884382 RepID=UPI00089B1692|nr:hypothetical protein [Paenibacillus sp. CF384]SDW04444.1 hypothetical protein SAMN05518855_100166 [Paenibacillus sp. CF384]
MAVKAKMTKNSAKQWVGQPVFIELIDGSSYWGLVTDAKSGQLILSGQRSPRKTKLSTTKRGGKAEISSFIPGLMGSLVGGGSMFGKGIFSGAGGFGGGSLASGILGGGGLASGLLGGGNLAKLGGSFGSVESVMGLMGNMGKTFPVMKMGYGMIKSIMPIMNMFKV